MNPSPSVCVYREPGLGCRIYPVCLDVLMSLYGVGLSPLVLSGEVWGLWCMASIGGVHCLECNGAGLRPPAQKIDCNWQTELQLITHNILDKWLLKSWLITGVCSKLLVVCCMYWTTDIINYCTWYFQAITIFQVVWKRLKQKPIYLLTVTFLNLSVTSVIMFYISVSVLD